MTSETSGESNIFQKFDEAVARKCYEFMLYRNGWRLWLKIFEYLFHGLLWFVAVGLMYKYGDKFTSTKSVILFEGNKRLNKTVVYLIFLIK